MLTWDLYPSAWPRNPSAAPPCSSASAVIVGLRKAGKSGVLSPDITEWPPYSKLGLFLQPTELHVSIPRENWEAPAKLTMCLSCFLTEIRIFFPHSTFYLTLSHQYWFAGSTPAHLHSWLQTHTNKNSKQLSHTSAVKCFFSYSDHGDPLFSLGFVYSYLLASGAHMLM